MNINDMMAYLNASTEKVITSNIAISKTDTSVDLEHTRTILSNLTREKFLNDVLIDAATRSTSELFCFNKTGIYDRINMARKNIPEATVIVPRHLATYIPHEEINDSCLDVLNTDMGLIMQTDVKTGVVLFLQPGWLVANVTYEIEERGISNSMRNYNGTATLRGNWSVDASKVVRMLVDGAIKH